MRTEPKRQNRNVLSLFLGIVRIGFYVTMIMVKIYNRVRKSCLVTIDKAGVHMKIITRSEEETMEVGARIGEKLKSGDVISLNGDLGAGKTHITKGIAKGLGVNDYITSPTFIIVNEYEGRIPLYHFDVYRINDIDEMYEIGFDEYLYGKGVCIVEWGEIVKELLPEYSIKIDIFKIDDNTREIVIGSSEKVELF